MALFGEKYGKVVRVVSVGPSMELCGGTHVHSSGEIGQIRILSETAVGQGVRRIVAVAGIKAMQEFQQDRKLLAEITAKLKTPTNEIIPAIDKLKNQIKQLKDEIKKGGVASSGDLSKLDKKIFKIGDAKFVVEFLAGAGAAELEKLSDAFREKNSPAGIVLIGEEKNKLPLLAAFTKDLTKRGLNAGKIVREIAKILEGKGGGAPHFARGAGVNKNKISNALEKAKQLLKANLE